MKHLTVPSKVVSKIKKDLKSKGFFPLSPLDRLHARAKAKEARDIVRKKNALVTIMEREKERKRLRRKRHV